MFSSFQIPFSLKIASACVLEKSVTSTLRLNIFIRLGRVDDDQILFRIVSLFDDVGYGYYRGGKRLHSWPTSLDRLVQEKLVWGFRLQRVTHQTTLKVRDYFSFVSCGPASPKRNFSVLSRTAFGEDRHNTREVTTTKMVRAGITNENVQKAKRPCAASQCFFVV